METRHYQYPKVTPVPRPIQSGPTATQGSTSGAAKATATRPAA
jgi:hypothetical protein